MLTLGIETSCDETAVALYCDKKMGIVREVLRTQIDIHSVHGGVVPELASREHQTYLPALLGELFKQESISLQDISLIACTQGPGLLGSLLVGFTYARTLACFADKPFIGINHLEAHVTTCQLEHKKIIYPHLCLLVSGGHTQLIAVTGPGCYYCLGETRDDACGEAFDKGATLLGLPYPGGPSLAKLADEFPEDEVIIKNQLLFKVPFFSKGKHSARRHFDFSFSGLKTQLRVYLEKNPATSMSENEKRKIAYHYQEAIVQSLTDTIVRALEQWRVSQVVIAGGVSANKRLRLVLLDKLTSLGVSMLVSSSNLCTDNAKMIAHLGYVRRKQAIIPGSSSGAPLRDPYVQPLAKWRLDELSPIT
ncbi:MAG: tRNA (adenosine(37)-N6)-threonylcarbamoyltransferase complex transferase subunit TsaD [Methylacidiphilales bacterium]|nr:tRNA (adenosine(37)-N6)-threonylcarbamoyltransferase complex transferase subunit TsaD [Candidatus Methylacidiphilales bacterium]